jgi:3-phosphoshikimate 1-carboxyvinyltransferase
MDELVEVDAAGDHRCAMSFCILAQAMSRPVRVHGARQIDTSYPGFAENLTALGGTVRTEAEVAHA